MQLDASPITAASAASASPSPGAAATAAAVANASRAQYLTFQLAGQDYGIEILRVQEIRIWEPPTRLPHAPDYVQGVINLRGVVVPILDLRRRFGLSATECATSAVVIVINTTAPRGAITTGIVVDAVCEVCELEATSIQHAPEVGSGIDLDLVRGLCTLAGRMLILLDAQRLVQRAVGAAPAAVATSS